MLSVPLEGNCTAPANKSSELGCSFTWVVPCEVNVVLAVSPPERVAMTSPEPEFPPTNKAILASPVVPVEAVPESLLKSARPSGLKVKVTNLSVAIAPVLSVTRAVSVNGVDALSCEAVC